MILSDREIEAALSSGAISLNPPIPEAELSTHLSTSSLDLRLGPELYRYRTLDEINADEPGGVNRTFTLDPSSPDFDLRTILEQYSEPLPQTEGDGYLLEPKEFVLGSTLEAVHLPLESQIAARVDGRSTLARLGLVIHMTAPTIHCGFRGVIVLEIENHGTHSLILRPNMRICQLVFERVGETPKGAGESTWQGQTGPT